MISEISLTLGEDVSDITELQGTMLPTWLRRSADMIARKTWSIYRWAVTDIIQYQQDYVLPSAPFRFDDIYASYYNRPPYVLNAITTAQAADQCYNWIATSQNQEQLQVWQGIPSDYILEGVTKYKLYPIPNYNLQDGLMICGYWGVSDKDWAMQDDCPLPDQSAYNDAVITGAKVRRCKELSALNPEFAAKYGPMAKEFEADLAPMIRDLYKLSAGATEARRGGVVPSGGRRNGWAAGWTYVGGTN